MTIQTPKIDQRNFNKIIKQILGEPEANLKGLRDFYLRDFMPNWTSRDLNDPGVVIVHLFARLMEIIIERLNGVPDKHFLAFLNLVGIDSLPGNPARAPIQFTLAQGNASEGEIPAGTQVATTQTETGDSFVFETEKRFFLSPAKLEKIFELYPNEDKYGDLSDLVDASSSAKFATFTPKSKSRFEHILYIGHDTLLGHKIDFDITLKIQTEENVFIPDWDIKWSAFKNGDWEPLTTSVEDTTNKLRSAETPGKYVKIRNSGNLEKTEIQGIESYWIGAKLTTPITPGMKLPTIDGLTIQVDSPEGAVPKRMLDQAFLNTIPIDVQKDFYPFGETPKFNDTFYFANEEVFSQKNQTITIDVSLSDALAVPSPDLDTSVIKLRWEYWHQEEGQQGKWEFLGESSNSSSEPSSNPFSFVDNTLAFTVSSKAGTITFSCPDDIAKTEINGVENYWIRARIIEGDYGKPAGYKPIGSPTEGFEFQEATYKPPSIKSFLISYKMLPAPALPPQYCFTNNLLRFVDRVENGQLQTPFLPFEATEDIHPALYLGFNQFPGNVYLSTYIAIKERVMPLESERLGSPFQMPLKPTSPKITWEYFNGAAWVRLNVLDGTSNFKKRGTLEFLCPADFASTLKFGVNRHWIRARLVSGTYDQPPEIEGVYFNTVWAGNIVTQTEELIGSSNGQANQSFLLSQKPVLGGEQIYVRELERPSTDEIDELKKILGSSPVMTKSNQTSGKKEFWVRWIRVDNFYGSSSENRHYTLDRVDGEIKFGNGNRGMIPPIGTNNIVATYQAGGRIEANTYATRGQIKVLKSSIPYVDTVTNIGDAAGGSDPETTTDAQIRGPQLIKHKDRAITVQDFVWLTKQASTQVALVKCLPNTNRKLAFQPGTVTMIIVPKRTSPQPLPSQELISQIENYLAERTEATVSNNISVIGPHYVGIDVTARVKPRKPEEAKTVEQAIFENLTTFLHPLQGGPEKQGWQFGRDVYISEIFELIEGTAGVDYVEALRLQSSFLEKRLVFANPSERFDAEIPAGAVISNIDETVALSVAEPISPRVSVGSIIVRGFQIGDKIKVQGTDGESPELEITRISKDTLYFKTFKLSQSFPKGSQVKAVGKNIKALLAEYLPVNFNLNSIRIKTFEGTGFYVKIKQPQTAKSITKTITRVEDELGRIPVNDFSLIYSGVHEIQMI